MRRAGATAWSISPSVLAVGLFGELAIETAGKAVDVPARRPGRLLLAWLALHPGVHARGDVAAALWPDVLLESARGSLRSALLTVRRCVGDEHVAASRATIGLQGVWVDALAFRDALAEGDPERAIALHTAPLLQGLEDEWVQRERDACREELGAALAGAAQRAEEAGELAVALEHTRRQLALDDLSEPAARDLMRRLAAAGDRSGAVAAYRRLSERLRAELQLAPSFETRRLAAAVRSGEAARATAQRPLP